MLCLTFFPRVFRNYNAIFRGDRYKKTYEHAQLSVSTVPWLEVISLSAIKLYSGIFAEQIPHSPGFIGSIHELSFENFYGNFSSSLLRGGARGRQIDRSENEKIPGISDKCRSKNCGRKINSFTVVHSNT